MLDTYSHLAKPLSSLLFVIYFVWDVIIISIETIERVVRIIFGSSKDVADDANTGRPEDVGSPLKNSELSAVSTPSRKSNHAPSSHALAAKQTTAFQKKLGSSALPRDFAFFTTHSEKKKILALDLDETLVHSSVQKLQRFDHAVTISLEHTSCTFYVCERPHLAIFLEKVCAWYDVVIFTASVRTYADPVIDRIDTQRLIPRRLFREDCDHKGGAFLKDLRRLNPDLTSVALVDNSPQSYALHPENAIPIETWMANDDSDQALLNLLPLLNSLRFISDIRSVLGLRPHGRK